MADDDVPRKLHRLRLVERLCIQRADGRRLRTASKGASILNSDDLDGRIVRERSHPRPSPRNLYGRTPPAAAPMALPLAVALATAAAAGAVARGAAAFFRGTA